MLNRLKKYVRKQGGNIEVTVYIDGLYEHCYKVAGSTSEEKYYLHLMDDKSRIATERTGAYSDDDAEPVKYVLEDHLGSSTMRLTEQGTEIDREEYYPYGESSLRTFTKKRYRYCGKERDEESGMMYYGARYYVPWLCRFTSVDPLAGEAPHIIPYAYADNNPLNRIDPDGRQVQPAQEAGKADNVGLPPNPSPGDQYTSKQGTVWNYEEGVGWAHQDIEILIPAQVTASVENFMRQKGYPEMKGPFGNFAFTDPSLSKIIGIFTGKTNKGIGQRFKTKEDFPGRPWHVREGDNKGKYLEVDFMRNFNTWQKGAKSLLGVVVQTMENVKNSYEGGKAAVEAVIKGTSLYKEIFPSDDITPTIDNPDPKGYYHVPGDSIDITNPETGLKIRYPAATQPGKRNDSFRPYFPINGREVRK